MDPSHPMPLKRNAIVTCADAAAGDFLADHWLVSLVENVDLSETDVVILDYGLTDAMKERIRERSSALVVPCRKDGHLVVTRFRDLENLLRHSAYEQVLSCDGGDIIFQSDISHLFARHPSEFRAISEGYELPFHSVGMRYVQRSLEPVITDTVAHVIRDRHLINGGFILAPREKMIALCDFIFSHIRDKNAFGSDQLLLGYRFYTEGFHPLDSRYNFILYTNERSFHIREGKFFDVDGRLIPVVHNTGRFARFRLIERFGFGPERNRLKKNLYRLARLLIYTRWLLHRQPVARTFSIAEDFKARFSLAYAHAMRKVR